jgi:hypothetical protein
MWISFKPFPMNGNNNPLDKLFNFYYFINMKKKTSNRLETVGDITLNLDYWDCECDHNYIHPNTETICTTCDTERKDQPNSRENERIYCIEKLKEELKTLTKYERNVQ